jgi:short-subunit dehydrogenase
MANEKVVFITGASSGIGRATTLAFIRAGYHVTGTARRIERLQALEEEITALSAPHGQLLPAQGDVAQPETLHTAVQQTLDTFGRLDVLVANAGVGHRGAIVDSDWDDMQTLLRTNIDGVLHSIRACVPAMRQHGGGHILIISSVAASISSPYAAIYAASKAFVSNIAGSLRIELQSDNIMVTDFLVGGTNSEFNDNRLGEGKRSSGGLPTMDVEQVARAIVNTVGKSKKRVILRLFDRLIVWGGTFLPGLLAHLAKRQYK